MRKPKVMFYFNRTKNLTYQQDAIITTFKNCTVMYNKFSLKFYHNIGEKGKNFFVSDKRVILEIYYHSS